MTVSNYIFYDSYGMIQLVCSTDADSTSSMATTMGLNVMEAVTTVTDITNYYVDLSSTPVLAAKTTRYSGISYVGSSTQLTLLPNPCWLVTEQQTFTCTDTVATMVYSVSGTYMVTVVAPAYFNENIEVTQL